jgi:hypothetical protein
MLRDGFGVRDLKNDKIRMIAIPSVGYDHSNSLSDSSIVKSQSAQRQALVRQSFVKPPTGMAASGLLDD